MTTLVLYDTEFTTWPNALRQNWGKETHHHRELVQLGALRLEAGQDWRSAPTFRQFATPLINPELSPYFTELTGITQETVAQEGRPAAAVLADFTRFCAGATAICSNGNDLHVLAETAGLQKFILPLEVGRFCNIHLPLHRALAAELGAPVDAYTYTSGRVYELFDLSLPPGQVHDALHDCYSLAATCEELERRGHRVLPW